MRHFFFASLVLSLLPIYGLAQEKRPAPQLLARDGDATHPLTVSNARADVVIDGYLSQTTLTFTFRNDAARVLEGELIFPLPEGATVSGYGLDVNGTMVDGVAVEKQKARVTYEREVHNGIDPGLLEHVSGNTFRTRIYPIPAKGTRSVKVQYVSELSQGPGGVRYSLPLDWGQPVGDCAVHIEAIDAPSAPTVSGKGLEGMEFKPADGRFTAEKSFRNEGGEDLVVSLAAPREAVAVERRAAARRSADDPPAAAGQEDVYFAINDLPAADPAAPAAQKPARIGVLWDASMSRQDADKARELELLRNLVERAGDVTVDLVFFRNVVDPPRSFTVQGGNADELLRAVNATLYDGGTNLGAIRMPANYARLDGARPLHGEAPDYAYWLLFTDGNGDLGDPVPPRGDVPVYAVSNDDRSNHTVLKYLAEQSGGAYLNLKRVANEQALAAIGQSPFGLVSAEFQKDQVAELYPAGAQPVQGRVTVAGKLLADEAKITLHYGRGATVTASREFTVRKQDAKEGGLVARQWAQMKVADLAVFPEKNHDALLAVGRDFDMATPVTSLLVLETAEQYVMYRVVPPKSRPDVYQAFAARIEQQRADEHKTQEERLQQVLAMWSERQKWYDQKYEYPANFKYAPAAVAKSDGPTNTLFAGGAPAPVIQHLERQEGETRGAAAEAPPAPGSPREPMDVTVRRDSGQEAAAAANVRPDPAESGRPHLQQGGADRAYGVDDLNRSAPDFRDAPQMSLDASSRNADGIQQRSRVADGGTLVLGGQTLSSDPTKRLAEVPDGGPSPVNVQVKEWDPNTPYLKALKAAAPDDAYDVYLRQRKTFGSSPAFFLDCADFFLRQNQREVGIRILTDVAELQLADARLLRIVAHRLDQLGEREAAIDLFQKILALRPEEPQSHRDLALAISDRADDKLKDPKASLSAASDYAEALRLLNVVITGEWARFAGIQVIAVEEANRIIARLKTMPGGQGVGIPLDPRLVKNLDLDLRVVMTWDTDNTDVDLWVTEPSGEKCFYQHNRTTIGGLLSNDFTDGYGPEEYCLRKLMPGSYAIQANFFGSRQQSLVGPTTVHATVITNFGRPDEKRQYLTLRLTDMKEVVDIGTVQLGDANPK